MLVGLFLISIWFLILIYTLIEVLFDDRERK